MTDTESTRVVSRRQRWIRAGLHSLALVGGSSVAFYLVFLSFDDSGSGFTSSWLEWAVPVLLPFQIGALPVLIVGAVRNNDVRIGQVLKRAALATVVGAATTAILWQSIGIPVGIIVAIIAIAPMLVGALVARWAELRACRRWGSQLPQIHG